MDEALVNACAENAHQCWMEATQNEGYISRKAAWGEEFMVSWDQLSERAREFDRVIVRGILERLQELGFDV